MSNIRFGAIADLHMASHRLAGGAWRAGINERGYRTTGVFGNALSIAEAKGQQCVVALGDVFDTTSPEPQLIAEAQKMIVDNGVPLHVILGNHDIESADEGDHACGPLGGLRMHVDVHERPKIVIIGEVGLTGSERKPVELWMVPFTSGATKDWLPKALMDLSNQSHSNSIRVLCAHFGIYDPPMLQGPGANWILVADDAIFSETLGELCVDYNIPLVLAGNWHTRRVMQHSAHGRDVLMVQAGTLCPTGWDNPGFDGYGSLVCVEVDEQGIIDVGFTEVPGPRFVVIRSEEELIEARLQAKNKHCDLYVRWIATPDGVAEARRVLESAHNGSASAMGVSAFRIDLDKSEAKAASQAASAAARSSTTREEALEAFVAKMPLPENVERARVFNLAKGYLDG